MKTEVEEVSPSRRKLSITLPAEEISSEYNDALNLFKKHAEIPGFRKGRAPVNVIKAKHHKDIVERLRDQLLPKSYNEAVEEHALEVVQIVDMDDDIHVKVGEPLSYSVTVDIKPDFSLPEYKGISLKKETPEVSEEEVDGQIDEIRGQRATFEDVEDRPVMRGDMVQVDFAAKLDGVALNESVPEAVGLDQGEDFWLQADENAFIPELGKGVEGQKIGETSEVQASFDDQFQVEELRGRTVDFEVTVKGIRARVLPEVDEEFLKTFEVKDEGEFRGKVRESLASQKEQEEQQRQRREIEKYLMEHTEVELPQSAVDEAANRQIRRIVNDMGRQGVPEEKIMEQMEQIMEAARSSAAHSVKLRYILLKIAGEEGLEVTEGELRKEMAMMAYAYGMKPEDLEKELGENNAREEFRGDLLMRNTLQQLVDQADIQG